MLFLWAWLRNRRRRQLLAAPFPPQWIGFLERNVSHYRYLTPRQQAKLRDDLRIFIADKYWEGCDGLNVTDEIQITVAGHACLLVLEMPTGLLDRVETILIYPGDYVVPDRSTGPDGVVREGSAARHGESWLRGPVVLSWTNARAGGRIPGDGENLILHEFAHQLDMLDGIVDGRPPLSDSHAEGHWNQVMQREFQSLQHALHQGRFSLLGDYAATNLEEFFAVATERFFENPVELQQQHAELYALLGNYYRQDPAAWLND